MTLTVTVTTNGTVTVPVTGCGRMTWAPISVRWYSKQQQTPDRSQNVAVVASRQPNMFPVAQYRKSARERQQVRESLTERDRARQPDSHYNNICMYVCTSLALMSAPSQKSVSLIHFICGARFLSACRSYFIYLINLLRHGLTVNIYSYMSLLIYMYIYIYIYLFHLESF